MFTKEWIAINTECSFISDLLETGATQIRQANYSRRGLYYQAFSNLSIGFERACKICIIVERAMTNGGEFPSLQEMKQLGHDLVKLTETVQGIVTDNKFALTFLSDLNGQLHQNIINFLSAFAKGDRYHNIDSLLYDSHKDSPIRLWYSAVDQVIWDTAITKKRKDQIRLNSAIGGALYGEMTMVRHTADDDSPLDGFESASQATGFYEAVSPHRQLLVLQMIRYLHEVLSQLNYKNMETARINIPFLSDYLSGFFNDDKYLRSRKKWDNLRPWK